VMDIDNIKIKVEELSDSYGKFIIEPLERGYGVTLGNSLRRVLLSSMPGATATAIELKVLLTNLLLSQELRKMLLK